MRIVVDTNVVVSALVFGGVPQHVLDLAAQGACSFYFSAPIQAEVERILEEKFGWSPDEIRARGRTFWSCGTRVKPDVSLAVVADDPDDDRILECALGRSGRSDHIRRRSFATARFISIHSHPVAPAVSRPQSLGGHPVTLG